MKITINTLSQSIPKHLLNDSDLSIETIAVKNIKEKKLIYNESMAVIASSYRKTSKSDLSKKACCLNEIMRRCGKGNWLISYFTISLFLGSAENPRDSKLMQKYVEELNMCTNKIITVFSIKQDKMWLFVIR